VANDQSPIPGLKPAGPLDLIEIQSLLVSMDYRWTAYFNTKTLTAIAGNEQRRLTHLKFYPDVPNGVIYALPAESTEYGAEKLDFSAPENNATVSLYLALLKFDVERQKGRLRQFEVKEREVSPGVKYWALNVRDSKTIPAKVRRPVEEAAASTMDEPDTPED